MGKSSPGKGLQAVGVAALLAVGLLGPSASREIGPGPGTTVLASVAASGEPSPGPHSWPTLSANGRYLAFFSTAPLIGGQGGQIYVRDLELGTTTLATVSTTGGAGNSGYSGSPSLSADGQIIAFSSPDSNLVADDSNWGWDVFVRDLQAGTTALASVTSTGEQANDWSFGGTLSADGQVVAFSSWANNLIPGDTNRVSDVFVRDLRLGTTTRASVSSTGEQANDASGELSISADGRFVAFHSYASNLVPGDTNGVRDIFVRDLLLGTTTRASVSSDGAQGDAESGSFGGCLSHDGRHLVFASAASNLVSGDTNPAEDVFVRDLQLGTTTLVSVSSTGEQANEQAIAGSISADGRFVAFDSPATNLFPGDLNATWDVFVRDLQTGTTTLASVSCIGGPANGLSWSRRGVRASVATGGQWRFTRKPPTSFPG